MLLKVNITTKETVLIGDVTGNPALSSMYEKLHEELKQANTYSIEQDLVVEGTGVFLEEADELEVLESFASDYAQQVVFFDNGTESDFDLALRLSPFIHNGAKVTIVSVTPRFSNHELVTHIPVPLIKESS